jgi:hypothetical protein
MDLSDNGSDGNLEGLTSSQLEKKIQRLSKQAEKKSLKKAEEQDEPVEAE